MNNFQLILKSTYYNAGYLNPGSEASNHLGNHGDILNLIMSNEENMPITINRTSNKNGSVRLYGGNELTKFIHNNYKLHDLIKFKIVNTTTIVIL